MLIDPRNRHEVVGMILMIVLLLLFLPAPQAKAAKSKPENLTQYGDVEVLRVKDGDTFRAKIQVWPDIYAITNVRVHGIDTPEHRSKCFFERHMSDIATVEATKFLYNPDFPVILSKPQNGKFAGRMLATAKVNGKSLADHLLEKDLAVRYFGKSKKGLWCPNPLELLTPP